MKRNIIWAILSCFFFGITSPVYADDFSLGEINQIFKMMLLAALVLYIGISLIFTPISKGIAAILALIIGIVVFYFTKDRFWIILGLVTFTIGWISYMVDPEGTC